LMAAVVGITAGGAAGLLMWWIRHAVSLFPQPDEEHMAIRWAFVVLVPVAGGLLAGGLRLAAARLLASKPVEGVPGVITAIAQRGGTVRGRGAVVTGLGTGVTIGSGGSCGHEGPSV